MTQQIPLVDLSLQTTEVELEVTEGIAEVIRSGAFVLGQRLSSSNRPTPPSAVCRTA